jgi:hypothetical protein
MTYSPKWLRLCEAEQAYRVCQYEVLQDEAQLVLDLKKALATPLENITALRVWAAMQPSFERIIPLLAEVVDFAIDATNPEHIVLAREVLFQYKWRPELKDHLRPLIACYLAATDEWHYRRIAELYTHLQYREELAAFLRLCRASDNVEIQEVGDDFAPL